MNTKDINFHCHNLDASVVSLTPAQYLNHRRRDGQLLTVGIHPWDTENDCMDDFSTIARVFTDPDVAAIGEVGLDSIRGASLERQLYLLRLQIKHAQNAGLPVVFHIVRRYDMLVSLYKEFAPKTPWAVHAFRAKPEVARQLASLGIYMSVGHQFNAEAVAVIPDRLLLLETDEEPEESIAEVIEAVAAARRQTPAHVAETARANRARFFSR